MKFKKRSPEIIFISEKLSSSKIDEEFIIITIDENIFNGN